MSRFRPFPTGWGRFWHYFWFVLNFFTYCNFHNRVWRQTVSIWTLVLGTRILRAVSDEFSKQFSLLFSHFAHAKFGRVLCWGLGISIFHSLSLQQILCNNKSTSCTRSAVILEGTDPPKFFSHYTFLPKLTSSVHLLTNGYSMSAPLFKRLPDWLKMLRNVMTDS